eukprot:13011956-Alexandrium_andersonii.AAC.1
MRRAKSDWHANTQRSMLTETLSRGCTPFLAPGYYGSQRNASAHARLRGDAATDGAKHQSI